MPGYLCPFCNTTLPDTYQIHQSSPAQFHFPDGHYDSEWKLNIEMLYCPTCGKISSTAVGSGSLIGRIVVPIFPESTAMQFPEYVPAAIRNDYEEARSILCKSPKAAATLARRCLQGMIHDFWNIYEKNLNAEITFLKDRVPPAQWKALDAIRSVGNIGAHMERDVNLIINISAEDAEKLIKLVEHLIDKWYVDRHETELLYKDVIAIGSEKKDLRDKSHTDR